MKSQVQNLKEITHTSEYFCHLLSCHQGLALQIDHKSGKKRKALQNKPPVLMKPAKVNETFKKI